MGDRNKVGEYTVEVAPGKPGTRSRPAVGPTYRNIAAADGWPTLEGTATVYELFQKSAEQYPDNKCLGYRPITDGKAGPFEYLTYKQVQDKATAIASALQGVGIKPKDAVGIYSINRPEWMIALQALNSITGYCVPLYDSLGETAIEYIVGHSGVKLVFVQPDKFGLLAKSLPNVREHVQTVVVFGAADAQAAKAVGELGIKVFTWDEFLQRGEEGPLPAHAPQPEDPATIMYTSGTTGNPKGVLLTHANFVSAIAGVTTVVKQVGIQVGPDDSMLSYLPLAHVFDRIVEEFALSFGARIDYFQGDVKKLTDDIAASRPTLLIAVPRILDRIAQGVQAKIAKANFLVRLLFGWAFRLKLAALKRGYAVDKASPLFDYLVFNKIRQGFGGKLRFIASGGAPLAKHTEDFCKVALCTPILQGYGLTETCAASFLNLPRPDHWYTNGPPLGGTEFRLEAVPELKYGPDQDPPRGEVCTRGPMTFKGYHRADDLTKESFDADGFFHTGDIGELTPSGCLKIVDRKKNIFKLAQGEYIAAEYLEGVYGECAAVDQIWVYGNSFESSLVAAVVPNKAALQEWASKGGVGGGWEAVCRSEQARKHVLEEVNKTGKEKRVKGFEMVRAVVLDPEQWTADNDLATPSLKIKRPQLQKRFQKDIDAMYKQLKASGRG